MGSGKFNVNQYKAQAEAAKVTQNSGFQANSMCDEFNPAMVATRYSKKGPFNEFRDIITVLIGLDVTGSMDVIPKALLTGKLGTLMVDLKQTFNRPNENLQISFAGIGDAKTDYAPLQATHFESDNRFAQQLQKIWLEGHGGANGGESYNLLWWYAANKTQLNYVRQDNRKGILITIGDDNVHSNLTASEIQSWLDPKYDGGDISNQVLLNAVREQYDVYHIVVTDGHAYGYDFLTKANKTPKQKSDEAQRWTNLLGPNNVIQTKSDHVANAIGDIVKRHRPLQKDNTSHLSDEEWSTQNMKNLTDAQWKEVLSYTLCPLTRKFMSHPVVWGGSKRAYEKDAVNDYVRQNNKDPITGVKLTKDLTLEPNLNIAQVCMNYKPFFDALPDAKREQLVQLALPVEQKATSVSSSSSSSLFSSSSAVVREQSALAGTPVAEQVELECPITHEIMKDPVILIATGQTYEKEMLLEWFKKHDTDPLTRKELKDKSFISNYALKSLCDAARAKQIPNMSG